MGRTRGCPTPWLWAALLAVMIYGSAAWAQTTAAPSGAPTATPHITAQPLPVLAPGQGQQGQGAAARAAQGVQAAPGGQQLTPQQAEAYQRLSPSQQQAIQSELGKSGGRLTPEAAEALKSRPEFKGLSPDDVAKGKQLLDQKERGSEAKEGERKVLEKKNPFEMEKQVITTEDVRDKSLFDRTRNIRKYQDISLALRPFGYEFFGQAAVRVTTDQKDIPVPMKYVVGPGDEVKLLLWGRVNAQYNLTVDRDGKITIPQIGPLFVAGMTFEEMSKQVITQSQQIVGTNVDISMGSLKTVQVFILGDVRRPGPYTIGSFATITDALLMAGGPTEIGSMRNVQLRRKGRLVTTFDLYDLLLKGDKSKDMTLMAGDVVFVPVTGPLVGIAGNVKRPAIYELRHHFDLGNLIELAGGIIPTAYTQQIQVERIVKNERHVVFDINDKHLAKAAEVKIQDADLVKIFSIVDMNVNVVYLNGNVKRPGKYEIKAGMKIGDLIKGVEELLPETYFDYALIKRLKPPEMDTVLVPFNLGNLVLKKDPAVNIELKPQDQIFVFNRSFFKDKPMIIIEGEIRGDCLVDQGGRGEAKLLGLEAIIGEMRNIELDLQRQGLFDLARMSRDISQQARELGRFPTGSIMAFRIELTKAGKGDLAGRLIEIENSTRASCNVALADNMRVKDIIMIAGGLTNNSYLEKGEVIRINKNKGYQTIYFNVAKAVEGDPNENLLLQDEDRVVIHSIWEQVNRKKVTIDGDVGKPGSYIYTDNMTVRDLVFKGGSILESAYVDEAELSSFIADDRKAFRTERKAINLKKALAGDKAHNLVLRPNDRLLVKRIPDWGEREYVTVGGEFKFPGRYTIQKGERLSSLISRAGGYTDEAYLRGAYFTRETVRKLQQKSIDEMAERMQRELLSQASASVATSISAEEVQAKKAEAELKGRLIEYMKSLKATGRMTIALSHVRMLKGSPYDIELEGGDSIYLPQKTSVVNVVGSVMSESSHIYTDTWDYRDYIAMAGGYARYADESNIFVVKVDGSARKLSSGFAEWNTKRDRWEMTAFGQKIKQIEPGDVIVVPERIAQIAWLREIRDITQILMNTAVVAATIIKLW